MLHIPKIAGLIFLAIISKLSLAADSPLVAVASNMSYAMTDIASSFKRDTNTQASLTFGSSGNFARQIIQGAPFRLFLSADRKYVDILLENGLNLSANVKYARGRIALFIPLNSHMYKSQDLAGAIKKLIHGDYERLTMANPEHAPYGLAAKQALQSAGLWVIEKKRLLLAENAAQTTQIALSGNVDAGIIPYSFAHLPVMQGKGKIFLIPEHWHQPLQQYVVLLDGASNLEKQFFDYMQNSHSQMIIRNYGYTIE